MAARRTALEICDDHIDEACELHDADEQEGEEDNPRDSPRRSEITKSNRQERDYRKIDALEI